MEAFGELAFGGAVDFGVAGLAAAGLAAAEFAGGEFGAATGMTFWHFGHLTCFPAMVSGTFRATPHWQFTRKGIRATLMASQREQTGETGKCFFMASNLPGSILHQGPNKTMGKSILRADFQSRKTVLRLPGTQVAVLSTKPFLYAFLAYSNRRMFSPRSVSRWLHLKRRARSSWFHWGTGSWFNVKNPRRKL
jgi:hypothetical protein